MINRNLLVVLLLVAINFASGRNPDFEPQQIHISFGELENEIIVTWTTVKNTTSFVKYGIINKFDEKDSNEETNGFSTLFADGGDRNRSIYGAHLKPKTNYDSNEETNGFSTLFADGGDRNRSIYGAHLKPKTNYESNEEANGFSTLFVDGGSLRRKMWIHRAHLRDLKPKTNYEYKCGNEENWSKTYNFWTLQNGTNWSPKIAVYGDLGLENAQSLKRLKKDVKNHEYDAILHIGDFAYDMKDKNGKVGDDFMNMIEPIAANVPYMVCPGNHESHYNFSNYKARFSMPQYEEFENMFYSWNVGPVHFVFVNTEAYYFLNYGIDPLITMYSWLVNDLEEASSPKNRAKRPWIIVLGHRPMYCSNSNHDDCTKNQTRTRVGLGLSLVGKDWVGMEKALQEVGVDLAIWAHEHSYERLWPIYDYKVLNGTYTRPYHNPRAPVHITTGSAGNNERLNNFNQTKPYWSAFRSDDYGYTKIHVINSTHLRWQQISDDQDGKIIDENLLVKEQHKRNWFFQDGKIIYENFL